MNPNQDNILEQISAEKVEIPVDYLEPGTILKGDTYTIDGLKIKDANDAFTITDIQALKQKKVNKIFYIPHQSEEKKIPVRKVEIPAEQEPQPEEPKPRKRLDLSLSEDDVMLTSGTIKNAKDGVADMFERIKQTKNLDIPMIFSAIQNFFNDFHARENAILNLLQLENKGDYLIKHSINVAILSMILASEMKLKPTQVQAVAFGGLLHDIGHIMIPDDILHKPGPLSAAEYKRVRKHPVFGYNLLKQYPEINESVRKIALLHHERINGSGYPLGLSWKSIGLFPHIAACADVFDAITSPREFKPGHSPREALRYLFSSAGVTFHPTVVLTFIRYMTFKLKITKLIESHEFVLLNTGEIAQVIPKVDSWIKDREDELRPELIYRPFIRIIRDMNKKYKNIFLERDLATDPSREIVKLITDQQSIKLIREGVKQTNGKEI